MENYTYRNDLEFRNALPAVETFAHWAFGRDGLPDLDLLAYGDFACDDRQPNILFCRSVDEIVQAGRSVKSAGGGFREVKKEERQLHDLFRENTDFLEACPEDCLLHNG